MKETDFLLPGFGEKTKESCNTIVSIHYCVDCGNIHPLYNHCKNWKCPECYAVSAGRAAHRIEDRLLGVRQAYSKIGVHLGKIIHVVLSPPQVNLSQVKLKTLKKEAIEYLLSLGVLGGVLVFHPFRIEDKYIDKLAISLRNFEAETGKRYKGGFWRYIHENPLNLSSWRDYIKLSPHFHVIGFYPKIKIKSNLFFEATGWTYKAVDVSKERSAFRTARYQLTHQNISTRKTYEYFGVCEPNKTEVTEETYKKIIACNKCDSENFFKFRCSDEEYLSILDGSLKVAMPLSVAEGGNIPHVWEKKIFRTYTVRLKSVTISECYAKVC
jgi:hypothetical protein